MTTEGTETCTWCGGHGYVWRGTPWTSINEPCRHCIEDVEEEEEEEEEDQSETIDARIRRCVARLSDLTGIAFTYGYLGDVDPGGRYDSRLYYAFAAHPGRVGTERDRLGGVSDPADLLPILSAALQLAAIQNAPR